MRIIPHLDIKGPNLIKGIQFEGLRIIGNPNLYAKKYYENGADELIFIDCVASLYGRNNLIDIINQSSKDIFIPITVGGGIRSVEDAEKLFLNGADKIAINSAAIQDPNLINELTKNFGSQAVVLSIQAKKKTEDNWISYYENGREKSDKNVFDWLLGICSGMQILFENSEEGESILGLGLIKGNIVKIKLKDLDLNKKLKIPNVGWHRLNYIKKNYDGNILKELRKDNEFYFVHSYYANNLNEEDKVASITYGTNLINSVVQFKKIYGCQFHPEKSGISGIKVINNFLNLD